MKRLLAVLFATIMLAGTTGCEALDRCLCKRPNPCAPANPCGPTPCESMPYGGGGAYDSGPYIQGGGGETIVPGPTF